MYLPMISGYELGQFLRILLWIFVPVAILSMLVTTWLHYRRRRREADDLMLSIEGLGPEGEELILPLHASGKAGATGSDAGGDDQEYKETVYKGIIWMKEKYEAYRDKADQRYERLKEELARAEKRYEELQASIVEVKAGDRTEKLLSGSTHALMERREAIEPAETIETIAEEAPMEPRPAPLVMVTSAEVERDALRDLLAERNNQIVFLQRQLDQRIKDFHMAEHEGRGTRGQIQELQEQAARTRQRLEEEVDHIRHQLEDEIAKGRRELEEQAAESKQQLEGQEANAGRRLEEKQRVITELEEQLHAARQKIEELVGRLRNNSQLLLNIYQELDKSLRTTDNEA